MMRVRLCLLVLIFTATFSGTTEAVAIVRPEINLRTIVRESPGFINYPGHNGIIWLKQHSYQIDTSGAMSVITTWVILGKSGLERKWLEWNIPIPRGGDAQIFEAALYDPVSVTQIDRISPQRKENEWHVNFQPAQEEFIIVLSYRQTYARNLIIQDMLWLSEDLPIWEHLIIAMVETGRDFEYVTNTNMEPRITREGNFDVYRWMIVNQRPSMQRSLRTDSRPWLAFGNRQQLSNFVRLLARYERIPIPAPPSNVEAWLKRGDFSSFFNWLQDQEANNSINIRDEIPERAPWSNWEKTILASSWINRFNSDTCRLFWRLAIDPSQYGFANESIILGPVIEIKGRRGIFFYEIGQLYEPGTTSISLAGEELYAPLAEENRLERRVVPQKAASDNRLSVIWNLNIEEDNSITGSVSLIIRHSWRDFLLYGADINDVLTEIIGRAAVMEGIQMSNVREGIEISAPLRPGRMTLDASGTNAIIQLNPVQPLWLRDLDATLVPYTIKFPMSIEVIYRINLPSNVRDILPPPQVDRDEGTIRYSERYEYFRRSGRLDVTVRLTFSSTRIIEGMEHEVAFALGRFGMQRLIPLRMR